MGHNADGLLADPPEVLRAFIRDGRILAVPAKRTRRRLLLDQVAQAFEPGRKYPKPRSTRSSRRSSTTTAPCAGTWSTRRSCPGTRPASTGAPAAPSTSRLPAAASWSRPQLPGRPARLLARDAPLRDIRQFSAHRVPIIYCRRLTGGEHGAIWVYVIPGCQRPDQGTASDGPARTPRRAVDVPTRTPARHRSGQGRVQNPAQGSARRVRYLLCDLLALLVLTAGGLYLARGLGPAPPPASGKVTALQTPATCGSAAAGASAAGASAAGPAVVRRAPLPRRRR